MKKVIFLVLLFLGSEANAWWGGGWGPYGPGYGPGFGYGYGYGGYGYMYPPLQVPSFNYQTTIVQQPPPVVVERPAPVIIERMAPPPPPKVEYRYKPCDDVCFKRYYSK